MGRRLNSSSLCAGAGLVAVALWIFTLIHAPAVVAWDFSLFYAAGRLEATRLYDLRAQQEAERSLWETELARRREFNYSAFLRPAYYRLALVPLARLPFWPAFALWTAIQASALAAAVLLLARRAGFDPVWYVLLPLCPYVTTSLNWGQDAPLVLLAVVAAGELLRRGHDRIAGALLALGMVKWNVVSLLPVLLLGQKKWKFTAVFLVVAGIEGAASAGLVGAAGVRDYQSILVSEYADYLAAEMPSLRGILLLLGLPNWLAATLPIAAALAAIPAIGRLAPPTAFGAAVAASVFLAYHTMTYDLLFLIIPAFVLRPFLQRGWKAATLVFVFSPIPFLMGKAVLAGAVALFMFALLDAARQAGSERSPGAV